MRFLFVMKFYHTLRRLNEFQVTVFYPKTTTVRAAKHRCICDSCRQDYGSCSLFPNYDLVLENLNEINLQSNYDGKNIKVTLMQTEKSLINDYSLVSKVS